ncbi:YolD-like family protein [Planococcus salinus]|uniref:YolD-like family protein n=1 Tax=Planococcus salinus TaxID=1848460 RepID=A0A3M8P930_9BACL|nr:YolD-like family protein [Planococcus salinus]RNF40177.1 YolD-like family protein [Planococcus salinus]
MKLNKHLTVKGQIKDRGRTKWTAMMLPEHVEMLREWQKEDRYHTKPELDDFDLEAIHEEIQLAYKRQCHIEIRVWRKNAQNFTGVISKLDIQSKILHLSIGPRAQQLLFDEIIGARTLE